jgi:hypothetical protein
MIYLPFNPSFTYLPVVSLAVVGFCGYSKKIVKATSDFVIFVFQEAGRAVRQYHKVVDEVRREKEHRGPRIRGRVPHTPIRRITPQTDAGRSRRRNG